MTNRATTSLRLGTVAGAALLASGCAVFSPVQTDLPYIPADGSDLTMPGLDLRNLVVVGEGEGEPGVLVGQVVNQGPEAVEIQFGLEGATPVTASVPAFTGDALNDGGATIRLDSVPSAPGTIVTLAVVTAEGGQNVVSVPVLPPDLYYAEYEPEPLPTPEPSATPEADASPEADATPEPSASPSTEG